MQLGDLSSTIRDWRGTSGVLAMVGEVFSCYRTEIMYIAMYTAVVQRQEQRSGAMKRRAGCLAGVEGIDSQRPLLPGR